MKKFILILIVLTFTLSIFAQQQTIRVRVQSNAIASGTVGVRDHNYILIHWDNEADFYVGINDFDIPISESYTSEQIANFYSTAFGGTSWGAWYDPGWVLGFNVGANLYPTSYFYMNFGFPKDVSVFVETNSDVESGTVELFHIVGTSLGVETVKWDNDDYNSDGITEVIFHDIFDPDNSYELMTAEARGTNVYDEYLSLETTTNFVWNDTEEQWENDDIYMNYSLPVSEARNFKDGWNWISFPRLFRSGNDPFEAEIVVDDLEPHALLLEGKDPDVNWMEWITQNNYWEHYNEFDEFKSSDGLKIEMSSTYSDYDLDVYGTQLPELTSITLNGSNEANWVGYWLEETQKVQDAFHQYWNGGNIVFIQHQFWSASRKNGVWYFKMQNDMQPTLSYGDMVIIKCNTTIINFHWGTGLPVEKVIFSEPEYFSYEEQADYVPLFIELDSSNMPQEIGAKVDGICIGATVVEDTLTQINAYTASAPPGDIELELYYGNRSENVNLSTYNCITSSQPNTILTKLSTKNRADAWFVNLREGSSITPTPEKVSLDNYPNPFNPSTTIEFSVTQNSDFVNLEVYNIKGQKVKTLFRGSAEEGRHTVTWNGDDENADPVSSGIYFYKLTTKDKTIMKKMLMLK